MCKLNDILNPLELGQLVVSSLGICFGILRLSSENLSFGDLIVSFLYMAGVISQLAVDCALGTLLYYQASLLPEAIFDSNWIGLTFNVLKKDVIFFLHHSQRIPQLTAYNLVDMHMMSFLKVIRMAFSLFTVMHIFNFEL
ncbi:LOW QUALITY PROTEIN: odorant receptor 33a-like [Diorhabda carinulata]|uniref:LOW QUALITY PROTEIN: odorant receptor 33a-like n=1 Tax=Diorhabda carinulata TaxID=1163345 RepID=UPI0025A0AE7D|nr:LOW QUALITY PROTEIN: odorant receptor 33a-like [Diorhabda carinulata]